MGCDRNRSGSPPSVAVENALRRHRRQRLENGAHECVASVDHLAALVEHLKEVAVRAELFFHFVEQQPRLVVLDEPPDSLDTVAQPVVDRVVQALLHDEPDRDAERDHGRAANAEVYHSVRRAPIERVS